MTSSYPRTRLRRTRAHGWSRALHRETLLTPSDLIWPLFVTGGDEEEPIASLPGVSRWPVAMIGAKAKEAARLGIPCVALFPNTEPGKRSERGDEALESDNLMCRAIRAIRDACGHDIGILTDVALDPYTTHGQDGVLDAAGYVANDDTVAILVDQAPKRREIATVEPKRILARSVDQVNLEDHAKIMPLDPGHRKRCEAM